MTILLHGVQISPDKNVNCPCTTAAVEPQQHKPEAHYKATSRRITVHSALARTWNAKSRGLPYPLNRWASLCCANLPGD